MSNDLATAPSDVATPGQDDEFNGWRVEWSSRRRPYFAVIIPPDAVWDRQLTELHEPVLTLRKPGRSWVEVKGQSDIDRPIMLARGMVSAMLCDAHFAREWGDTAAALRYDAEVERWHRLEKIRTNARAIGRVAAWMFVGPAGAGAKGR